ncbi:hypothetical protein AX774_g7067 [Zancudomyces culisetae]|uniref:Uncharacterized protein n=1 Tax=Zancudomyces culisetae TaxID=1213189 RepID=A0A1R1PEU2_ZANCU|nr:hypothetical protein AX774_g7067 [Zancudomyces culisetae]|eukprot:OMH79515.1 hypothetical protein AX774_g7067 [Zancudomyces culisetae]
MGGIDSSREELFGSGGWNRSRQYEDYSDDDGYDQRARLLAGTEITKRADPAYQKHSIGGRCSHRFLTEGIEDDDTEDGSVKNGLLRCNHYNYLPNSFDFIS